MSEHGGRASEPDDHSASDLAGLARVVAVSSLRVGTWAALTGVTAGRRAVDVLRNPEHAAELAEDLRTAATAITQAMVGDSTGSATGTAEHGVRSADIGQPAARGASRADNRDHHRDQHRDQNPAPNRDENRLDTQAEGRAEADEALQALHEAGQELLRRSRDVWTEDRGHPAYARIVEELAPDEGRILVLLLHQGPQPSLDVRTGGLVGTVSSTLVAPGLNMIGARAGCRYVDRVPSYLHNLERLGLVWFSRETVRDPMEYQVLEAQPEVVEAMRSVRRAKIVRRSIHLTPFGRDFCLDGLGLQLSEDEVSSIPSHADPAEG